MLGYVWKAPSAEPGAASLGCHPGATWPSTGGKAASLSRELVRVFEAMVVLSISRLPGDPAP